jgi:uncharacterized membrane protein YfcA
MSPLATGVIFLSGAAAGAVNAVAGGGTLLSFPALLWLGRNSVGANATSTLALLPGSLGGAWAFRQELGDSRALLGLLLLPSLVGGGLGAYLLLHTDSRVFLRIVPFLILGATLLLMFQQKITARLGLGQNAKVRPLSWRVGAVFFQLLVGIYGGYFGAGIGILMLAALGLLGETNIHRMNGTKNVLGFVVNAVAAVGFVAAGAVNYRDALVMALGALVGGYAGARLSQRVERATVRRFVVGLGWVMAAWLYWKGHS